MEIEVLFGPADFEVLPRRDLGDAVCVVLDVLRATTTAVTALARGARAIRPVSTIGEAVAERARDPEVLLAGERGGLRIRADQAGGIDFDFGNSPREFTAERVAGRTIVMTTTNGTRALRAAAGAGCVVAAGFLNRSAVVDYVCGLNGMRKVLVVCSGTGEETALEDLMGAGAVVQGVVERRPELGIADSAWIALAAWRGAQPDPVAFARKSSNARRLLAMPDLAADVDFCLRCDVVERVPVMRGGELV